MNAEVFEMLELLIDELNNFLPYSFAFPGLMNSNVSFRKDTIVIFGDKIQKKNGIENVDVRNIIIFNGFFEDSIEDIPFKCTILC